MEQDRLERVYREHGPSVIRYCTFSVGTWHDGEDIAAEVFARLIVHEDNWPDERIARWLFTVARNLCADHRRTIRRRDQVRRRLAEAPHPEDPAWVDPSVWEYLRAIKEGPRLVVFLHAVEGRSFAEIARLLGKSTSAVKMTHYRALTRVRRAMEADGIAGTAALMGGPSDA